MKNIRVALLGAGNGAHALLKIFSEDHEFDIAGIYYRNEERPAVALAREMEIPLFKDFRELVEKNDVDLVIDATGAKNILSYLANEKKSKSEVLFGHGARFMWNMVSEYKKRQNEVSRNLEDQNILYSSGVMLASAANTEQTLDLIMEAALNLTNMSAGSLALYDEERGIMQIKVSSGFDKARIAENFSWKVRPGGLTGHILSNDKPTVIGDLRDGCDFDAASLIERGVRAIIATPLKVEGKIVGILYLDDFKERKFTNREVNMLNLLSVQAAAAIDKALLLEKAEILAVTDELTKLYNHRYFVRSLEKEMKRANRYGYPVSLFIIDVDHFKHYNDTFGHLKGNMILKTLANLFSSAARDTDIVARFGGEEFTIILIQADEEMALYVAERIRAEVESYSFPGEEKQPSGKMTVSIGIATSPADGAKPVELIECADKAMYRSKESGRNKVTSYGSL